MPEYLAPGVYVEEVPSSVQAIAGVGTSTAGFIGVIPGSITILEPNPDYDPTLKPSALKATTEEAPPHTTEGESDPRRIPYIHREVPVAAKAGTPVLCTNFTEFKRHFGGTHTDAEHTFSSAFSTDAGQNTLAHAVFGFFNNGGRRCYVARTPAWDGIDAVLESFKAIDEIAIVLAPGVTSAEARQSIVTHCEATGDRFAILDSPQEVKAIDEAMLPPPSKNAAFYFPWIEVFDPVAKLLSADGTGTIHVPPGGHVAGIYARVDAERGVHKAPANEVVRGALGVRYAVTKDHQSGLNPKGINCIRDMNGNLRVWGARTIGGDANGEWKYINVRRLFLFLRESIDEGTQWTVFEPNDARLWAKITRNVTAFLTTVWRDGALFGNTLQEAFYVKCDSETNPPEERELGRVITEIGIAVVRPAEFVIFRISQWPGPQAK